MGHAGCQVGQFSCLLFLLHLMRNDPSEAWCLTSFSRCILNLGLALTIVLICDKQGTCVNPVELKQDTPGHILTTLQIAYAQDGLVKGGSIIVE